MHGTNNEDFTRKIDANTIIVIDNPKEISYRHNFHIKFLSALPSSALVGRFQRTGVAPVSA